MSKLKVDVISNVTQNAGPSFIKGATIPMGKTLSVLGNINISGVVTASSFFGDGSNLTNLGGSPTSKQKSIAWSFIFGNYYRA